MKIEHLPFRKIDWTALSAEEAVGETGTSFIKTVDAGPLKCRMVDYEAGYLADHWCDKGHIFLTLAGELLLEFRNGETVRLIADQGFQVGDGEEPHRIRTAQGARAFIID